MALKDDLLAYYKNANMGVAASGDDLVKIDSFTGGSYTPDQAKVATLALVDDTTGVAIATYQAFTGHAPSADGLAYLVNSATNTNDLNDAYYAKFNQENRLINFSINLATGSGDGAAAFAALYGASSYKDVVAAAYDKFVGNAAATAAGVNVSAAVANLSSDTLIAYLTSFVKNNTPYKTDAEVTIAVKAALVAEVLNVALTYDIGNFAKAVNAMVNDLSDGKLDAVSGTSTPVDITTVYNTSTGSSFTLTTGIDNIVGTSGNDVITTSFTKAADNTLTALDVIDGGAGDDTLTIVDAGTATGTAFAVAATATIKNIETINLTTTGTATFNTTGFSGVKNLNVTSADTGGTASTVTVADTTAATVTVASGNVQVNGGTGVKITNAGAGTNGVAGDALTTVAVTGGGVTTINNNTKTTLTTVSLTSVDANTGITGNGVKDVTIGGVNTADRTVTITNAASGGYDLTVHAAGTAKTDGTATKTTVTASTANTVAIDAQGKASLALNAVAATAVSISGSGALTLDATASTLVTSITGAAATGSLTLGDLNAAVVTVSTGSGNDSLKLFATTAATVSTGAGNDTVTLGAALAAGSSISLGAGNDKLLGVLATAPAASTSTKITTIDAGDGTDTLAAALVNVGNAAQFKNFEVIGLNSTGFDLSLLTGSTLTGLELFGTAATGTYSNVTAAQSLLVSADTAGANTTLTFTGVSGTADAYSVTFAGAGSTTSTTVPLDVRAGTLSIDGIEALTINSGSSVGYAKNAITIADANLRTVAITGSQDTALTLTGTVGATGTGNGVSLIDASAATGKTTINTTGAGTLNLASAGLTIKTGVGADSITLSNAKTFVVDAGAGNDTIVTGSGAGSYTLTGGAGKDSFDVHLSLGATGTVTITDFVNSGDNIVFADKGAETFKAAAVDVSLASDFASALAAANTAAEAFNVGTVGTDAAIVWFQYGGNTYILEDNTSGAVTSTDLVVKLTGLVDLSAGHATFAAGATPTLTLV